MKNYIWGLIFCLTPIGAIAQDAVVNTDSKKVEATAADVQWPPGVATDQNPFKKEFAAKAGSQALLFRPNENMPDVVNEALLKTMANTGKLPKKAAELIGYLPKLKVLPCAQGCEGDDYEKAVKEFIKGYNGDGKRFKLRGEMIVQVRWYNTRPWYQRGLPYGEDRFGVSFIMEGKLVSLGRSSGIGSDTTAPELAKYLGARLGAELGLAAGIGLKPSFLLKAEPGMLTDVGAVMGKINRTVVSALGSEDVTSRIEPVTDANKQLLPAIDGIQPGEIDPINEVRYLNLLL